jgi:hypothetical protein
VAGAVAFGVNAGPRHAKLARMSLAPWLRAALPPRFAGVLLLGAALALAPGARAQPQGIAIGWQDCRSAGGPGGANQNFGCVNTINNFPFFPTVRLTAGLDSVYAVELVIDVDVAADSLPAWWHMEPGGCRQGGWSADTIAPASCEDVWGGAGAASAQGWLVGVPGNSTRHGRLLVAASVPSDAFVSLSPDVGYSLCRVVLRSFNSTTCAGCTIPACLVFNSVLIRRLPGSSFEELLVTTPESVGLNQVVWQGTGADCQSVPVRRTTWGAVKALYH